MRRIHRRGRRPEARATGKPDADRVLEPVTISEHLAPAAPPLDVDLASCVMTNDAMKTQGEGELDQIVRDRFFLGVAAGVFVDVGAARPDFLSMSALYRALGWRVIAIEPNPVFCQAHRAAGHKVLEYACSDHDEDAVDFEVVDSHGAPYEGGQSPSNRSRRSGSRIPTGRCERTSTFGGSR